MEEELITRFYATSIYEGPDYTYLTNGIGNGFSETRCINRFSEPFDTRTVSGRVRMALTNNPALNVLREIPLCLINSRYDLVFRKIDRKMREGDLTYVDDIKPFLMEMYSQSGFVIKDHIECVRFPNTSVDRFLHDIQMEAELNRPYDFKVLRNDDD